MLRYAVLLMVLLCLPLAAVGAQDESLTYNVPVEGTLDDANPTQTWTLQTVSADRLSIHMERLDGNLIPDIFLLDANGQSLNRGPADRTFATAAIENYRLPTGGAYQITVSRRDGDNGVTSGRYRLIVIPLATAEDNPNNTLNLGPIALDTPVEGELTAAQWTNRYTLSAQGPDVILISAERVTGTLLPEVEILDVNGAVLRTGYLSDTSDRAEAPVNLPGAGDYTVVVRRQRGFGGSTEGVYRLAVTLLGAGVGNPSLSGSAGTLEYDTPVEGQITPARWYEDYNFTALAADNIGVLVERTAGNLQPEVLLLGGSGQELRRVYSDDSAAQARLERYRLDVPGNYTVRVMRSREARGLTTGSYRLTLILNGSGVGSPLLAETSGTAALGEPATGEITNMRWQHIWLFDGEAGQRLNFTVTRADGTLIPNIEIQDSNGQRLRSGSADRTLEVASVENYALPGSGQYRLVVGRQEDQTGYTTGGYTLLVRASE